MTGRQTVDLIAHVPRMRRVALRLLGDPDEADEVVQDACLRAVRSFATFNGQAKISTWLHRIVTRCALDRIRARRKQTQRGELWEQDALPNLLAHASEGPFEQTQRRELCAILEAAMLRLPDDCRDAFALTQLDGYSYDEAAQIEGLPRGTIASRVYRAKRILMGQLCGLFDGERDDDR